MDGRIVEYEGRVVDSQESLVNIGESVIGFDSDSLIVHFLVALRNDLTNFVLLVLLGGQRSSIHKPVSYCLLIHSALRSEGI